MTCEPLHAMKKNKGKFLFVASVALVALGFASALIDPREVLAAVLTGLALHAFLSRERA